MGARASQAPSPPPPTLTGEQIAAISRFPDQNPHPVMRVTDAGSLLYANVASKRLIEVMGGVVGQPVPEPWLGRIRAAVASGQPFEVPVDAKTFDVLAVDVPDFGFINLYGTDVTARKAVGRFPDANPNPVFRLDWDGRVVYANAASESLVAGIGGAVGRPIEASVWERLQASLAGPDRRPVEVPSGAQTFALLPVDVPEFGFINVYGTDVTARNAVARFPDANPNPVFRLDWKGRIVYANAASSDLINGLGCRLGGRIEAALWAQVKDLIGSPEQARIEVEGAERIYALLPVDVPEFGFINVYGTDITAAKALERLHRENERLLLNILPEPIADRIRAGERLIADRFDDVTLLFADIVGFTELSSTMRADQLVGILNEVFTVFDELVEEHGLEKVKTIGDAYMVVGGLTEALPDHTVRVARMAVALATRVAELKAADRLGVRFRVGINCGPVVAGVIGTKKFIYDIWGDTVNLASRMESSGIPGRVQVSEAVAERLRGTFELEPRGRVEVKGKGLIPTWFLGPELRKAQRPASRSSHQARTTASS